MRSSRSPFAVFMSLVVLTTGCKKYSELSNMPKPAYIRVFNMITNNPNILQNGEINTFLTFLLDPVMDKSNVPQSSAVEGDFLTSRLLYTTSYPTDAANTVVGAGYVNYEYPGRAHALTAPPINGFDCSSWAQVPSGKHRIVFVSRPPSSIPFDSLTVAQRSQVIADTVIDFQAGEVYTLEAVLKDLTNYNYGVYVRKEEFTHRTYSTDSLYVGIYKVCANIPQGIANNGYSPVFSWFEDSLVIAASYYTFNYLTLQYDFVPGAEHDSVRMSGRFSDRPAYMTFPALPQAAFFDPQGVPAAYGGYGYNPSYGPSGTLPCIMMTVFPLFNQGPLNLYFWANSVNYSNWFIGNFETLPNLNLISAQGGKITVYPTLNIMEIVNDRVYITQVQNGFSKIVQ